MGCAGSSQKNHAENAGGGGAGEDAGMGVDDEQYNPLTEDEVNARIVSSREGAEYYGLNPWNTQDDSSNVVRMHWTHFDFG